jgi:hypothetical protein
LRHYATHGSFRPLGNLPEGKEDLEDPMISTNEQNIPPIIDIKNNETID